MRFISSSLNGERAPVRITVACPAKQRGAADGSSCNKYSKKNQDRNIHSKKIFFRSFGREPLVKLGVG